LASCAGIWPAATASICDPVRGIARVGARPVTASGVGLIAISCVSC
jgi:hypothetical protein